MKRLIMTTRGLVLMFLVVTTASAQTPLHTTNAKDRQSVNVTVYNSNIALVRETRSLTLPSGRVALRFSDVASQIRSETVHLASLSDAGSLQILEQNYQYDLLNPAKLLDKYVGRELTLVLRRYENNSEVFTPMQATLLANNGGQVWRINNQIVINPTNIVETRFPDLPANLVATPTLVWDLENGSTRPQTVEASYLTNGMNWQSDYVLVLNADDAHGDLQGWVTLTNTSGVGFENARLQLVAGNLNRVGGNDEMYRMADTVSRTPSEKAKAPFQEKAFFEYHLYTLQRPASIREQETKQVSLLEASGFNVNKEYVINGQSYYYSGYDSPGTLIKEKIGVYVQFRNSQDNKLGMPLPAGTIRLYQKDDDGSQQFIGEDRLEHTPRDEDLRIKVGDAFDVVAERKETDYKALPRAVYEYAYEIKIRNHKSHPITVIVNEPLSGDWKLISSSFKAEKTSSSSARFRVTVEKDAEAILTYRVRVKS